MNHWSSSSAISPARSRSGGIVMRGLGHQLDGKTRLDLVSRARTDDEAQPRAVVRELLGEALVELAFLMQMDKDSAAANTEEFLASAALQPWPRR
jgi:hypothetical protein